MTALIEALAAAVAGAAPDTIALMRVLMEAPTEAAARDGFAAARARCHAAGDAAGLAILDRLLRLWDATPGAWAAVRGTVALISHRPAAPTPDAVLDYWAACFDRLVERQPEASVALYSLGDANLLAAVTDEIVTRMVAWGLIGPDATVVDLGCGIGRFLQALAPRVRHVTGLDLSARMVAEAQRRCAGSTNVAVRQSDGRDLAGIGDSAADLVLAADVFPYLVEASAGLVQRHVAEAARVLRPGGALLVLNWSYRGDLTADRAEAETAAAVGGLTPERNGERAFGLWDGTVFLLRKPAA